MSRHLRGRRGVPTRGPLSARRRPRVWQVITAPALMWACVFSPGCGQDAPAAPSAARADATAADAAPTVSADGEAAPPAPTDAPDDSQEGLPPPLESDFDLELGVSSSPGSQVFRGVRPGDAVPLVPGPQGLQHVEAMLRAPDLGAGPHHTRLELVREADGARVSIPFDFPVPYYEDGGWWSTRVLFVVVPEPNQVVGAGAMVLRAVVTTEAGAQAEARRTVSVHWH